MMSDSDTSTRSIDLGPLQPLKTHYIRISRQYRALLDRTAPHLLYRWLGTAGLLAVFMLRIVFAQGVRCCSTPAQHVLINVWFCSGTSVRFKAFYVNVTLTLLVFSARLSKQSAVSYTAQGLKVDQIH